MSIAPATETWIEVDDPAIALDDVPVSQDITTRRLLGIQVLVFFVTGLLSLGLSAVDLTSGPETVLLVGAKLGSAAVALSIIDRLGWYRRVGLSAPRRWNRLWLAWLPAVYVVLALARGVGDAALFSVLGVAGLALAIGLEEEIWARGLLLETMRWRGTTIAVVLSSLWFGLLHTLNLLSGQPASVTLAQVWFAFAFGLAVGAVRVRVGTIWLPIALHALYNFGILLTNTELGLALGMDKVEGISWRTILGFLAIVALPLAVYGLVLARPSKVPGPDGRMRRKRVKAEPWEWPASPSASQTEAANVLGRWPAPPPDLVQEWYHR